MKPVRGAGVSLSAKMCPRTYANARPIFTHDANNVAPTLVTQTLTVIAAIRPGEEARLRPILRPIGDQLDAGAG